MSDIAKGSARDIAKCRGLSAKLAWSRSSFKLNVELYFPAGVTALFGPSGSGKTTILRCLAGLDHPVQGEISLGAERWQDVEFFLPAHKRSIGYVFQSANLLPHLSVEGNLAYARQRRAKNTQVALTEEHLLAVLGIQNLLNKNVAELSGGEAQRVAVARALIRAPDVLLLDEPLAALDVGRKQEVLPYLDSLFKQLTIPVVYVTHALEELTQLADQLIFLDSGSVVASGGVEQVLAGWPATKQLRRNACTILAATVIAKEPRWNLMTVMLAGQSSVRLELSDQAVIGSSIRLRIDASDVSLTLTAAINTSILNVLPVWVVDFEDDQIPSHCLVRLALADPSCEPAPPLIIAKITRKSLSLLALRPGLTLFAQIKSVAICR